ncbi:MAG: AI-2E family transporter [Defluviitaleaceae bacterium]|nr:AI-2E family transporter [Defluviitaleaceae bacterium]
MEFFRENKTLLKLIPYTIIVILFAATTWLLSEISFVAEAFSTFWAVVRPFVFAFVLAYIFDMPCTAIQKLLLKTNSEFIKNKSRLLSSLILLLILIILLAALLNFVVPIIVDSVALFIQEIPTYQENIQNLIYGLRYFEIPDFLPEFPTTEDLLAMITPMLEGFDFEYAVSTVISGVGGIFGVVFRFFLTLVGTIYFVIEKDRIKSFAKRFIAALTNKRANEFVVKCVIKLDFNFRQYIYTQTIDGLILGTLMTIALFFIGSPFALLLGIMLGIVNYIPYFGSIFGTIVAALVIAFTQDVSTALIAALIMFIIQQLDANIIQPKLMSNSFSISPLLVIISVTIGSAYAGIMGMLIAIPLASLLRDIIEEFIEYRTKNKNKISKEKVT